MTKTESIKKYLPGILAVAVVAICSRLLFGIIPGVTLRRMLNEAIIAILLGLLISNVFTLPSSMTAGIKFCLKKILRLGIILMGLRLSFQDVVGIGASSLILVFCCIALVFILSTVLSRFAKISKNLATLITVGTCICGNSAIIATAPVIDAEDEDVSFAVATITVFGLTAVLLYPIIGRSLGLSDMDFGLWAGTAVNDTSQVVACGSAYSAAALDVATIVKLVRNTLMVPIIIVIGLMNNMNSSKKSEGRKFSFSSVIPWFVVGFLALSLIRTLGNYAGFFPRDTSNPGDLVAAAKFIKGVDWVSKFCILMALSAIGLSTDFNKLKKNGIRPLLFGLVLALTLAVFSLVMIKFVI